MILKNPQQFITDTYMNFYHKDLFIVLPQYRTKLVSSYMVPECISELPYNYELLNDTTVICHTNNSYANLIRKNESNVRIIYEDITEDQIKEGLIRTYPAKFAYKTFKTFCKKQFDNDILSLKLSDTELDKQHNVKVIDIGDKQYLNDDNIENTLSFIFLIDKDEEKLNILLKNLNDKMFSLGYNFAEKRCFNIQVQPLVNRKLILVQVIFETEFYEQKFDFSKVLYHVTFFNKLEKIRKNGLVPYSKSYKFDYPERVYLFNNSNEEIILKYAQQKCKATNNNYACILKISSEKLQYSNLYKSGKITFYIDTMFKTDDNDCNALFTYNNIPKDLISDYVLKIEFDNTFNIIKTEIIEF